MLIKDKRTNTPVTDLKIDNFEIFDNGRLRQPTYFSGQGEKTDQPLALVVLLPQWMIVPETPCRILRF